MRRNYIEDNGTGSLPGIGPRMRLGLVASALPVSHDKWMIPSSYHPFHVLHRWYIFPSFMCLSERLPADHFTLFSPHNMQFS